MTIAEVNGARIAYDDGGGAKAAIVFSHGLLMDRTMFAPQVAALRDEFRCISWDERGHGETESDGPFTYWDSARDLLALLDHLAVPHALLVGMSQGGFLSLRATLLAPERVDALFLIDSQAGGEDESRIPIYEAMLERSATSGVNDAIAHSTADVILGPGERGSWIAKWKTRPVEAVRESFATLVGREDLTPRLGEIKAPALVVHGEDDAAIPVSRAEQLCNGLPACEGLVRIPEAGHAANLSHPDAVNKLLADFCRRHAR